MSQFFQVFQHADGNLSMADGSLIDRGTGAAFTIGDGDAKPGISGSTAPSLNDAQEIPRIQGVTLLGGSGRNVIVTGLAALDGVYRPTRPDVWKHDIFTLTVTGASAATISDEDDVVAELTTGGDAPGGSYVATTYGEDTYNGGSPFTLTGAKETGFPGTPNDLEVEISEGTALGGRYTSTDGVNYVHADNSDWTLVLNVDGTAELAYDGTVVALRATGPNDDPCGIYQATDAGLYLNPEFAALAEGEPEETNPFGTLDVSIETFIGPPRAEIAVSFLGETAGNGHNDESDTSDFIDWVDNDTIDWLMNFTVNLDDAWDAGVISTYADVEILADWSTTAGTGQVSIAVIYNPPVGSPIETLYTITPGILSPAGTQVLALRIGADGTISAVGGDWTARVSAVRKTPRAGVVYVSITEGVGEVDSAAGPFFAATLPSPSGSTVYFAIAESDGDGAIKQGHTGPLIWDIRPAGRLRWGTVADSTDPGTQGEVKMDGDYIYGCVATDTWGRLEWDLTPWP